MVRTPVLRFRAGQPQSSLSLGPQAFLGLAVGCFRSHLKKKVTWHPGGNEARQRLFPPDDARLSEPGRHDLVIGPLDDERRYVELHQAKWPKRCPGTSLAKQSWLVAWHIRDETYSKALPKSSIITIMFLSLRGG